MNDQAIKLLKELVDNPPTFYHEGENDSAICCSFCHKPDWEEHAEDCFLLKVDKFLHVTRFPDEKA